MVQGIKLAVDQAGGKAGNVTVKYTSLDDSTAQAGNWDPQQTAANARKVAQDKKAVAYIGEFNSGATRDLDPDPQPGRHRADLPGQHVRGPDHERAGLREGRAAEVLPDRQAHLPAHRPARHDPGRRP